MCTGTALQRAIVGFQLAPLHTFSRARKVCILPPFAVSYFCAYTLLLLKLGPLHLADAVSLCVVFRRLYHQPVLQRLKAVRASRKQWELLCMWLS